MDTLTFYTDPGHGWLEVPVQLLKDLRVEYDISQYSYRAGSLAYLEEDCDAGRFLEAAKSAGMAFSIVDNVSDSDSWIRRLPRF